MDVLSRFTREMKGETRKAMKEKSIPCYVNPQWPEFMMGLFSLSLPPESSPESPHHYDFSSATPLQKAAAAKARQVAKSFMLFGGNGTHPGK